MTAAYIYLLIGKFYAIDSFVFAGYPPNSPLPSCFNNNSNP